MTCSWLRQQPPADVSSSEALRLRPRSLGRECDVGRRDCEPHKSSLGKQRTEVLGSENLEEKKMCISFMFLRRRDIKATCFTFKEKTFAPTVLKLC